MRISDWSSDVCSSDLTVVEREHRSIGAAAAFSTDIGPSLELFWEHRNLAGANEQLRVSATGSLIEQSGALAFRKPAFLRSEQDLLANLTGGSEANDDSDIGRAPCRERVWQ